MMSRRSFPIPCRNCGKLSVLRLSSGVHSLTCPGCSAVTTVDVAALGGGWQIRTAPQKTKPPPKRRK